MSAKKATQPLMTAKKNILLSPFKLKHITFKNRILSTSHAPNYITSDHMPGEKYQLYHAEKAKGGMAMSMFGGSSNVSIDSPSVFGQIDISSDRILPYLSQFSDTMHSYDCKLMCQLTHLGRRQMYNIENWTVPIAPSPIREHSHRSFPKAMDTHDINRVINDFAFAAQRCMNSGLDGVELLASGHLLGQFLSPSTNKRTDEYGCQTLDTRLLFLMQVLEKCREICGEEFIIGLRMVADEEADDGYTFEDGVYFANRLKDSQMIDFLNINFGENASISGLSRQLPNMSHALHPHLEKVKKFRELVPGIALWHAGRIMDIASAKYIIEEDIMDMVGMTRAHIADPHIVSKLMEDREDDIRPCVGAAFCIDRIYVGNEALCIHNASTGREKILPHDIQKIDVGEKAKEIVIIGGGIAGLECARICAIRGHNVTVYEANKYLGGQLLLASQAVWRRDLKGIIYWREQQCRKLGVQIKTETYFDESCLDMNMDVIICCTGGTPNMSCIQSDNDEQLCSTWDVLSGGLNIKSGANVLIFDNHGNHHACSVAEYIASKDSSVNVELVTGDRCIAEELGNTNFPIHLRNLYNLKVKMTCDMHVIAVENECKIGDGGEKLRVKLQNEYTKNYDYRYGIDHVIVENGTLPVTEVYDALKDASKNGGQIDINRMVRGESCINIDNENGEYILLRVGDALVCRNIHAAVLDALRICKDL